MNGTLKRRTVAAVLTTSSQDIYTVPTSFRGDVDSIIISNGSNSPVAVTLLWYSALSNINYDIMDAVVVAPRSVVQIDNALFLLQNDKIKAFDSVGGNSVTVSVRVTENFLNNNL